MISNPRKLLYRLRALTAASAGGWVLLAAVLFAGASSPIAAQEATIKSIDGDAEVKFGEDGEFEEAEEGMKLNRGDYLTTGFMSEVVLEFDDAEVTVGQLTQLVLNEFFEEGNLRKTSLYMRIGSVEAHVKPKAAIRSDFNVVTPTVTASVRGSIQIVKTDAFGTTVEFTQGHGVATGANGQSVQVGTGDQAEATEDGTKDPDAVREENESADLTPEGTDSSEEEGARGDGKVATRPASDPTNPYNVNAKVGTLGSKSALVFRFEIERP